ncbi:MAG: hypothetical protein KDE20_17460 [Caldilineaceae bacterium]|nr:hypothetical protein [Caldilineaceae bacterium]MCB9158662.1 hypothetical protein [Caldilineaceae bacterium]
MNRLVATLRWDLVNQYRQGFYIAGGFVIVVWAIVLWNLPAPVVELLLPFLIFFDLSIFGFYFMAGMLFLEKGDGVLQALVVTPMRSWEYLVSKSATLALLAVLVSVAVVLLVHGFAVNWWLFVPAVALNSWLLVLIGFMLAARFDAINEFLIPSIFYMVPSQLPALQYFGIWESPLLYLVPTMPSMLLLEGAFGAIAGWQIVYAFVYLLAACVLVTWWAQRTFVRFVVRAGGE